MSAKLKKNKLQQNRHIQIDKPKRLNVTINKFLSRPLETKMLFQHF